jgi:hypothetical protein
MSHYDHVLMHERLSHLEALAHRQQLWAEVRRGMVAEQRRAPHRIVASLASLRQRARRRLKARRALA